MKNMMPAISIQKKSVPANSSEGVTNEYSIVIGLDICRVTRIFQEGCDNLLTRIDSSFGLKGLVI